MRILKNSGMLIIKFEICTKACRQSFRLPVQNWFTLLMMRVVKICFLLCQKRRKALIASDGKIPVYSNWEKMISEGKIAPDTLLTLAGLASFYCRSADA